MGWQRQSIGLEWVCYGTSMGWQSHGQMATGRHDSVPARNARNGTTSELFEFVNVRVSSSDLRNASLNAKPIRLRVARNSIARMYKRSSFAVRYKMVSVVSSRSKTSRMARYLAAAFGVRSYSMP